MFTNVIVNVKIKIIKGSEKMESQIELKNLKGTIDFLPEDQIIRENVINILKASFKKYGYLPLETPILNYYELLAYKYEEGAEILSEIYKLYDQGGRRIGLRYDLTVPFCKVIGMYKDLKMPFRRYEIGRVFRNGPVKLGRLREFYQCDVDVVGIDNRLIEIEQMILVINTFKELNIDINIKWNNRKLMVGILSECGIEEENFNKVIGIIDKMQKISLEELKMELKNIGLSEKTVEKLLDMFNKTVDEYENIFSKTKNEILLEGIEEIKEIQKYIKEFEIEDNTIFTPTLARGLGIYTGIVFEFYDKKNRLDCSLGGGGRFDKIITEFMNDGQIYPAVGLSFGLEPIFTILKEEKLSNNNVDVYIIPMDTEIESLKLANYLRSNNINVLLEMNKRKIKKCFEYADKSSIKYVIVLGEDEIKQKKYTLKNMDTGEQTLCSQDELVQKIKS